jgi:ArsR family transcriptional regulator, arsenate/arsenite/antimonite-responsive transcriptional repressor
MHRVGRIGAGQGDVAAAFRPHHAAEKCPSELGQMVDISAPVCCAPVAAGPMSDADALQVALRLKALADPARMKIMSLLFSSAAGEENSGELAAVLGLTESTVSHDLTQLRRAGLVESDRRGMNVYHRPHRDAVAALCAVLDPNCCT